MSKPIETIKGWYIAAADLKTSRTHLNIREGETLSLEGTSAPRAGSYGYHACPSLLDALTYNTLGGVITHVEVSGDVDHCMDNWAFVITGRSRKTLRIIPPAISERICREFAADVAERMLCLEGSLGGRDPVKECVHAVKVARAFAAGKATEDELQTARLAASALWDSRGEESAMHAVLPDALMAAYYARFTASSLIHLKNLSSDLETRLLAATEKT